MKNEKKPNSGIPLVIIVLVLVGVVVGAWYLYNSSKSTGTTTGNRNSNATANAARNSQVPANAPVGAQPPQMLGSPTATVTLEEFADFQCGSCAHANPVLKQIQSQYGSRIKFIFRHFPLTMHDKAYDAAVAAEAAGMQGKFWDMQNLLFTNQTAWASNPNYRQMFSEYAGKLGLDVAKFQSDAAGIQAKSRVDRDLERGRALSVSSTPTLYINGKSVPYQEMNASSLKLLIDAEFQGSAPPVQGPGAPAANSSNAASNSK
jgi:protein-disulfide isomerase